MFSRKKSTGIASLNDQVSLKEYIGYFCYGFGECFNYGLVGTFIMIFYTDVLGISAVASSIIFLIARVWDAVNDPVCASIMDMRRTKKGKFKGYLKIVPIFVAVSTLLCFFSPDISIVGKVIYAGFTYILWGTVYTVSDIPFWSVSAVISGDSQEKAKLVCSANVGVAGGIGMASIIMTKFLRVFSDQGLSASYTYSVAILALLGFCLMMFGYSTVKERVAPITSEKVHLKDVISALKVNHHLFKVLAIFIFKFCMDVVQGIIVYFFTYNLKDASLMGIFGVIGTLSALAILFLPSLAKKVRKRDIYIAVCALDIILRAFLFYKGYENVTLVMTIIVLTMVLNAFTVPLVSMMLTETIEYSEVKTGKRCEAIAFSGQTFTGKLSVALAGAAIGIILSIVGYVPNQAQTEFTLNGIFFAITIIPAIGSLCRILILATYRYTEKEHEKDVAILKERYEKIKLKKSA